MSKLIKLTEKDLSNLIKKTLREQMEENANYMFFSNLEQIKRQCEMLLDMDPHKIDDIIQMKCQKNMLTMKMLCLKVERKLVQNFVREVKLLRNQNSRFTLQHMLMDMRFLYVKVESRDLMVKNNVQAPIVNS